MFDVLSSFANSGLSSDQSLVCLSLGQFSISDAVTGPVDRWVLAVSVEEASAIVWASGASSNMTVAVGGVTSSGDGRVAATTAKQSASTFWGLFHDGGSGGSGSS